MDYKWIRPAVRPVRPREIEELSTAAMEVLEALEKRYLPTAAQSSTFRAEMLRQPWPRPWQPQRASQSVQHLQPGSPASMCSQLSTVRSNQTDVDLFRDSRQPLLGVRSKTASENQDAMAVDDCGNNPSLDSCFLNIIPHTSSHTSSPMSSFNESENENEENPCKSGDLHTATNSTDDPTCPQKEAQNNSQVHQGTSIFLFSPVKSASAATGTAVDNDSISLFDSTISNISVSSDEGTRSFSEDLNHQERDCTFSEPQNVNPHLLSFPDRTKVVGGGNMLEPRDKGSNREVEDIEVSLLSNRSPSPIEELTQPVNTRSSENQSPEERDELLCDFSFDDTINTNKLEIHPVKNNSVEKLVLSPHMSKQPSFSLKENTPGSKVRKFLGTPFKRALSSSCISSTEISDETVAESGGRPFTEGKENLEPESDYQNRPEESLFGIEAQSISSEPEDHAIALPFADNAAQKTPKNAKPSPYFSIFTQTKRKANEITTEKSATGPPASCKKRLKFMVPYKKQGQIESPSTHKKIQDLAAKLTKEMGDMKQTEQLSDKSSPGIIEKLSLTPPQETSLTIRYRGGSCQLDRPKTSAARVPDSILLRIVWSSVVQFLSVPLQKTLWSVTFLTKLFTCKSRIVCFEAQEMIGLLVDKFNFCVDEVSSQWLFLDPLIGCWLLKPDEPPHSFKEVLTFLKMSEECHGAEMLLCKLSHSAEILYENLTKNGLWKVFLHLEMRITPILACMELHGIQVNAPKLEDMAAILKSRLEKVQTAAYSLVGRPFQLTSPQQLSTILYDQLKLDTKSKISVKETDKRHNKSTSEAMLVKLKASHPLPGLVLEFRSLHKLKSTYVDALLSQITESRIYTTWDQISAATGRITSIEPNLQTIPKQPLTPEVALRTAFVARQGFSFLGADFQHIELRVFAHLAKDTALIAALSQDSDVFKVLSKQWLQIQRNADISEEDRDETKRIVYALMYGAGPSKLVEILQIDFSQACSILKKFSGAFPKMQEFTNSTLDKCRKQGYLATEAGRRRWFPLITSQNLQQRTHSERQAVNFLIQGTAADLCKCAMVHAQRHIAGMRLQKPGSTARLLLQIHDELLWEVSDSDVPHLTDVVQEAMEGATTVMQSLSNFTVPLPVVMKVGKTWGDMRIIKRTLLGPSQQSQK